MSDPSVLDHRSRPELIAEARTHGIDRPERMTRAELKDEILRRTKPPEEQAEARGLFGVARSMLATMVESGLNLPDAAALIRGTQTFDSRVGHSTPVATVTLAEIYAAQGHKKRALGMLDEVLAQEPDHEVAQRLRRELGADSEPTPLPPGGLVETSGEDVSTAQPPAVAEPAEPPEAEHLEGPGAESAAVESPVVESPVVELVAEPPLVETPVSSEPAARVVLLQREAGVAIYWEVDPAWRADAADSRGRPTLRVVSFSPGRPVPRREERDWDLAPGDSQGTVHWSEMAAPASVRAALGWLTDEGFVPSVVGRHLEELSEKTASTEFLGRLARIFG